MSGAPLATRRLAPAGDAAREPSPGTGPAPSRRPLGVGGILDRSLDLYARRFVACFGLAFLAHAPATYLGVVVASSLETSLLLLASAIQLGAHAVSLVLVASVVGPEALGRPRAVPLDLLTFAELFLVVLFMAVGGFAGALCCVVPGVLWLWLFSVVPMVCLFEPRRGRLPSRRVVRRGAYLVQGLPSLGRWLGIMTVRFLVFVPASMLVGSLDVPAVRAELQETLALSGPALRILEVGLTSLFTALGSAYGAILMVVYYVDLRVRREGLDLELELARLGPEPPREVPA